MSNPQKPPNRPPPPPAEVESSPSPTINVAPSHTQTPVQAPTLSLPQAEFERIFKEMAERMGLAVGVAMRGSGSQTKTTSSIPSQDEGPGGQCPECGLQLRACKGEHVQMVVFPRNSRFARWWPGLPTNGIIFRSNGPGHYITVPKKNDFAHRMNLFEREEEANLMGRDYSHNSGYIGPHAAQYGGFRSVEQSFPNMDRHAA